MRSVSEYLGLAVQRGTPSQGPRSMPVYRRVRHGRPSPARRLRHARQERLARAVEQRLAVVRPDVREAFRPAVTRRARRWTR